MLTIDFVKNYFDMKHASMLKKKDVMKNLFKIYKYIDIGIYWFDDEENPERCNWIDIEGIGYGWIWIGNKLRARFSWLQRRVLIKYINSIWKEIPDDNDVLITGDGAVTAIFAIHPDKDSVIEIRLSDKSLNVW